jgi:sec-independent protein translocase protein TatC|uniref:Twin-arginine translocase subunit TatC n=1 Tax=Octactis speculum TaxID=3111310 RepID=A0A514CPN8_9STRA|nr:twin-arginine translocase subunit TatC [Dictyocha speculum]QDH81724.1 twin-arginine translocase subunit TatC [Dictyocha speculum]|tara:strand:- start:45473 stop:46207 length:735 start_codon:yes stop_codon:yes gene_type:complete
MKFKFKKELESDLLLELPFTEHVEELRQRSSHIFVLIIVSAIIAFLNVKDIVQILELPVTSIKFFQLAPGEYFISTVKIAFYSGFLVTSPFLLTQLTIYIIPGLNKGEKSLILPLLLGSTLLFFFSLIFSYFILIPAALNFFISYGESVIEPLWSFNQYFDFILVLFYTTGLAFQIPIFQIIIGIVGIISGKQMLEYWKYVILIATIIGAILTPSTDPITQLLLSGAIIFLYLIGASVLLLLNK